MNTLCKTNKFPYAQHNNTFTPTAAEGWALTMDLNCMTTHWQLREIGICRSHNKRVHILQDMLLIPPTSSRVENLRSKFIVQVVRVCSMLTWWDDPHHLMPPTSTFTSVYIHSRDYTWDPIDSSAIYMPMKFISYYVNSNVYTRYHSRQPSPYRDMISLFWIDFICKFGIKEKPNPI